MTPLDSRTPGPYRIDVDDGHRRASWSFAAARTDVGRAADNDLVLHSARVSRHHLSIERDRTGLFVTPRRGASLPTIVDGHPIAARTPVDSQAVMRFGALTLTVVDAAEDDPAEARLRDRPDDEQPHLPPPSAAASPVGAPPGGRGSVIINPVTAPAPNPSPGADRAALAPPRRPGAIRWLRRHWPLALALVVAAGLALAASSMDQRAPARPAAVPLCDQDLTMSTPVACPGPDACIRAAEDALAAARRHADSRLGVVGAPNVIAEAHRAIALSWPLVFRRPGLRAAARALVLSRRPVTEGIAGVTSAAGGLVAQQADLVRGACRQMRLDYRRAQQATRDRDAATGVCRQMMQLFPDPADPRHVWARRELAHWE